MTPGAQQYVGPVSYLSLDGMTSQGCKRLLVASERRVVAAIDTRTAIARRASRPRNIETNFCNLIFAKTLRSKATATFACLRHPFGANAAVKQR